MAMASVTATMGFAAKSVEWTAALQPLPGGGGVDGRGGRRSAPTARRTGLDLRCRRVAVPPPFGGRRWITTRIGCELPQQDQVLSHLASTTGRHLETRLNAHDLKERIRKKFVDATLSTSCFDTAWVAMVPSLTSPEHPCFPQCIEWILKNQNLDGSWTSNRTKFLIKDVLSSTLACIIALGKWNVGDAQVKKAINFIQVNSSFAIDERQYSPIGFNIIFTGMLLYAKEFGLHIPIDDVVFDKMLDARNMELQRANSNCWKTYLAYVAEGISHIQDWHELKNHQNKNGSLFNSPSTTASMLLHIQDAKALEYLQSVVNKFGNAVPTIHPSEMYTHLHVIDLLEELGIAYHFNDYIERVMETTYRGWLENDEEIFSELSTCALAFRLLRMKGYNISSNLFHHLNQDKLQSYKLNMHPQNMATVLELYKASQVKISENEYALRNLNSWSGQILKQSVLNYAVHDALESTLIQEVNYNLEFSVAEKMDRPDHKRKIEAYNVDSVQCLKTSFVFCNVDAMDILSLAVQDFNAWQRACQEELQMFYRWTLERRLDKLVKFDINLVTYNYFAVAATISLPDLSDARVGWAKNSLLATLVDDFFDISGSLEERVNLLDLCKRWDSNYKNQCCSEQVFILFDTIYDTVEEISMKSSSIHGYSTTSHLIESWVATVIAMNQEAKWRENQVVPTIEEYVDNGYLSFALGAIIASSIYFVGPKLSWDIVRSLEFNKLFKLASLIGRLLNDINGFERESKENKLFNSVSLHILNSGGMLSEEDAKKQVWDMIEKSRIELLELVSRKNGSVVPRECKQIFWNLCTSASAFYKKNDGFRTTSMIPSVHATLHEPINVSKLVPFA